MRICLVSGEYPPMQGGVGDCTRELGRALVQLGHQIVVLTSHRAALSPNTPVLSAQEPEVCPIVGRWDWTSWRYVFQTVRAYHSDVLHIQYQTAAYGMHPAINFLPLRFRLSGRRPRVLATFHDLRVPYLLPKAGALRRWVNLSLARWCDAAIATNIDDHQQLQKARLPKSPHLIPIGSNIRPLPPPGFDRAAWRSRLGVGENETLLCYFGFLNESKGGETLFRTLAELMHRGRRVKLLMIGGQVGDSDPTNVQYFEHVRALGEDLGLEPLIQWTGYTPPDQVSANFLAADICVLPYRDGVSYRRGTLMAAIAHGMPIISTRPRVAIPTLADGESILLVAPDDAFAAADAVERLMSSPELRTRLAQGALGLAENFTWDRIAAQTARLYSELLLLPNSRQKLDHNPMSG
jgi:glycosyltransferase involved in cell wall biosynthesis